MASTDAQPTGPTQRPQPFTRSKGQPIMKRIPPSLARLLATACLAPIPAMSARADVPAPAASGSEVQPAGAATDTAPAPTSPAATPAPDAAPAPAPLAPAPAEAAHAPVASEGSFDGALGKGLTFRSSKGDLTLNLRTRAQLRGVAELPDDGPAEVGFVPRRLRLAMRAAMPKQDVELYIQLGFAPGDLDPDFPSIVRDAMLTWRPSSAFHLRFGQGKVPFGRERVISSSALSYVDRTIVNAELNLDRDAGLWFGLDQLDGEGHLGLVAGVSGGNGRNVLNDDTGLLYVARLEYKLDPKQQDYTEFDFRADTSKPVLGIGAGAALNQGTSRARSTIGCFNSLGESEAGEPKAQCLPLGHADTGTALQADLFHTEVDLIAKWHGWSLQAELLTRHALSADAGLKTRDSFGWFASLGRAVTDNVWVGARFAEVLPWDDNSPVKPSRELRGTLGFFPHGHDLKIQLDAGRLYSSDMADGTTEVRVQTQLFL